MYRHSLPCYKRSLALLPPLLIVPLSLYQPAWLWRCQLSVMNVCRAAEEPAILPAKQWFECSQRLSIRELKNIEKVKTMYNKIRKYVCDFAYCYFLFLYIPAVTFSVLNMLHYALVPVGLDRIICKMCSVGPQLNCVLSAKVWSMPPLGQVWNVLQIIHLKCNICVRLGQVEWIRICQV